MLGFKETFGEDEDLKKIELPCGCVFWGEPHPSANKKTKTDSMSPVISEIKLCKEHSKRLITKSIIKLSTMIAHEFLKQYTVEIEVSPKP